MKKLTKLEKSVVKSKILAVLTMAKKSMSLLDIKKVVKGADRSLVRKLEAEGSIKSIGHYLHNSNKTFTHEESKKIEVIKGTYFYTYKVVEA